MLVTRRFWDFYLAIVLCLSIRAGVLMWTAQNYGVPVTELQLGIGPAIAELNILERSVSLRLIPFPWVSLAFVDANILGGSNRQIDAAVMNQRMQNADAWLKVISAPPLALIVFGFLVSFVRFRFLGTQLLCLPWRIRKIPWTFTLATNLQVDDEIIGIRDDGVSKPFPSFSFVGQLLSFGPELNEPVLLEVRRKGKAKIRQVRVPALRMLSAFQYEVHVRRLPWMQSLVASALEVWRPIGWAIRVVFPVVMYNQRFARALVIPPKFVGTHSEAILGFLGAMSIVVSLLSFVPYPGLGGVELICALRSALIAPVSRFEYVMTSIALFQAIPFLLLAAICAKLGLAQAGTAKR